MRMSMNLRPMMTCSLECTECGQLLAKREGQAVERDMVEVNLAISKNPPNTRSKTCLKCGQTDLEEI